MTRWALYTLAALSLAGIVGAALFPLSLALKLADAPVGGDASGTVWKGELRDAVIAGAALGDVQLRTRALPTLIGAPTGHVTIDGPYGAGGASGLLLDDSVALSGVDLALTAGAFGFEGPFGTPLVGTVRVTGDAVVAGGACREAALTVETDVLAEAAAPFGLSGPALSGPAACEDGTLVADLAGRSADVGARALVRVRPGTYVTELTLTPADPRAGAVLTRYGFRAGPDGYTLTTRGTY